MKIFVHEVVKHYVCLIRGLSRKPCCFCATMTRFFSKGGELLKRTEQRQGSKVTAATVHIKPRFKSQEFVQKVVKCHVCLMWVSSRKPCFLLPATMTCFFSKAEELLKRTEQRQGSKVTPATVHIEPRINSQEFVQKVPKYPIFV